jgi:alanine racemase
LLGRSNPSPGAPSGAALCGVIKKNAYGLGAAALAPRLLQAGCQMLAVYSAQEAEELIKHSVSGPILVLMPVRDLSRTDGLYRHAIAGKLHLSVHDLGQRFGMRIPIHLYVDTGMSRAGLSEAELVRLASDLDTWRYVRVAGVYSHLATADSDAAFAQEQRQRFERLIDRVAEVLPQGVMRHLANTCGLMRGPQFHFDLVRVGLGLLGYAPDMEPDDTALGKGRRNKQAALATEDSPLAGLLRPVVRWLSRVVHVQRYESGSPVGYQSTHRLKRPSVLGVVPVGYGDGYPLLLSNRGVVRVQPVGAAEPLAAARVLGCVNMDQIVIDLTELAQDHPDTLLEATVELISADPEAPNALPKLAAMARSHCYEMLCRLSPRLPRRYVK